MKQNKEYYLFLTILFFTVSGAFAYGANVNYKLEYLNNKLSVNAEKVPLGLILSKIQEKTGIEFALDKKEFDSIISIRFQSLSKEKALSRLLHQLNYAVVFGPNGNIQKVSIIGKIKKSLKSSIHGGKISSTSNTMIIKKPNGEGMKITRSQDDMVIEPPSKERIKISHPPLRMVIEPPSKKGMKITNPSNPNIP